MLFRSLEKVNHATLGKRLFAIEVQSTNQDLSYAQTFVRSISKIYWVIIILDILVGIIVKKDDRFLDYISRTVIVKKEFEDNSQDDAEDKEELIN